MTTNGNEQQQETSELEQELQGAANISRMLAHLFRRELTEEFANKLDESGTLSKLTEGGYDLSADRIHDADFIKELRTEYAYVFLGPGPKVSPYGSVHHPDDIRRGQLWGKTTQWLHRFVKDHGVEFRGEKYDGIPDHIGHELELYSMFIDAEIKALGTEGSEERIERLRNSQRLLVELHWLKWVPIFCSKVEERAQQPFYSELCRFTLAFVYGEAERLGCAPKEEVADKPVADEPDAKKSND